MKKVHIKNNHYNEKNMFETSTTLPKKVAK